MDGRSFAFYKETAFGLWGLYWLHQWGIPHRMCRFHCCLAAHQRTRKKDSAESSFAMEPRLRGSLDSTSSTRGVRCGGAFWLPRAYRDIVSLCPVLSLLPSYEFCVAICVRAVIVRVSVGLLGLGRSFFIIGGRGCSCLRLRGVWLSSFVGFALTANGSAIWRMKGRGTEPYRSILNMVRFATII